MSKISICNLTPDHISQVMIIQRAYQEIYPNASVIPGEVYLSSAFDNGENVFCAFDEKGSLKGYAPIFPNLTDEPDLPHIVWVEVKISPELTNSREIKDLLFEQVIDRTKKIVQNIPEHDTRITFQYHASERASIEYVLSQGCVYTESVFRLMRDLSQDLPAISSPDQIEVRPWRMESEKEQQAYVQARNEAFPEALISLDDWQFFLQSPVWQEGTSITAFDGTEIVGSVIAYWDDATSGQTGKKTGYTEYIFVRSKWRNRGIAAFMISQGLNYLKLHGCELAFLEVKASNQHALDLYYRLGYKLIEESYLYVLHL